MKVQVPNQRKMKGFAVFAVVLFIGLFAGNFVADYVPVLTGNSMIDAIIEWLIICIPVWFLLRRRQAKKALAVK
jgi:hypothetical protein